MKVWVCEEGEYSDRRVMAVFTQESEARLAEHRLGWDVKEWDTDQYMPSKWPSDKEPWNIMVYPDRTKLAAQIYVHKTAYPASMGAIVWKEWMPTTEDRSQPERYAVVTAWCADRAEAERIAKDKYRDMR